VTGRLRVNKCSGREQMELILYTRLTSLAKPWSCKREKTKKQKKTTPWKQRNYMDRIARLVTAYSTFPGHPRRKTFCFVRVSENGQRSGMFVHKFCPSYSVLSVIMSLS